MRQQEWFDTWSGTREQSQVPGFTLREDYVTPDEERFLLSQIDAGPWVADWRRRVQQYGIGYGGEHGGKPTWGRDFPNWLLSLALRVQADAQMDRLPENCVINEYIPPLGIGPHRDYGAFGPTIACVSLGADIVLDFSLPEPRKKVPVIVPARSFWVITGAARSEWMHGIAPRLSDMIHGEKRRRERRVSITFRTANDPTLVPAAHGAQFR